MKVFFVKKTWKKFWEIPGDPHLRSLTNLKEFPIFEQTKSQFRSSFLKKVNTKMNGEHWRLSARKARLFNVPFSAKRFEAFNHLRQAFV